MSSLKVPAGCKAVVYQHADKSGWAATFEPGDYRMHAFLAQGGVNDDASSIDVLDGNGEAVDDDKCNYWKELGAKPEVPWTICSAINCEKAKEAKKKADEAAAALEAKAKAKEAKEKAAEKNYKEGLEKAKEKTSKETKSILLN
jgi:hypothetical protein